MIKRYKDFIKGKTNEEFVMAPAPAVSPSETETQAPPRPGIGRPLEEPAPPALIPTETEEPAPAKAFYGEEEEEGGDVYAQNMQHLADLLGVQANGNVIDFEGKKITFPSETEMFHVDKKKFKTAEEVVKYLQSSQPQSNRPQSPRQEIRDEMDSLKDDAMIDELEEKLESKSYKSKFRKFKK